MTYHVKRHKFGHYFINALAIKNSSINLQVCAQSLLPNSLVFKEDLCEGIPGLPSVQMRETHPTGSFCRGRLSELALEMHTLNRSTLSGVQC